MLVRLVVPDRALLDLQEAVNEVLGGDPGGFLGPGRWTPHVTLAHRIRPEQVGAALAVLDGARELDADAVTCRRWDSDGRRVWDLWGSADADGP